MRVGKKDALVQGLGSWRCTVCKKPCKVTVSKATVALRPGEEVVATVLSNTEVTIAGYEEVILG